MKIEYVYAESLNINYNFNFLTTHYMKIFLLLLETLQMKYKEYQRHFFLFIVFHEYMEYANIERHTSFE